jgi:hypothetical protein
MAVTLQLHLEIDDSGAVTAVRKLGDEVDRAEDKVKKAGKSGSDAFGDWAKGAIAAYASIEGVTRVLNFLWDAMKGAAQEERAIAGLASQMKDLGISVDYGKARVEQFADAMKKAGYEDDQTRAAIARMLPITKDLEKAILATNVAYGAAIKYNQDVNTTMELMVSLMVGSERGLLQAQKQFGVILDENAPKSVQFQSALDQLTQSTKGIAENTRDAEARMRSLGIMFDELKEGIGADLLPWFGALSNMLAKINLDFKEVIEWTTRYGYAISTLGMSEGGRAFLKFFGDEAPKSFDMMSGHGDKANVTLMDCHTTLTTMATEGSTSVKAYKAQVVDLYNTIQRNADALIAAGPLSRTPGTPEMAVPATVPSMTDTQGLLNQYYDQYQALTQDRISQMNMWELDQTQAHLEKVLDLHTLQGEQLTGLQDQLAAVQRERVLQYLDLTAMVFGQISQLLMGVAGKNKTLFAIGKALGYAQAIINTFVGVSRAFADYPWPYSAGVAAIVLASGLAQVARIAATKMPQGQAHSGLNYVPRTGSYILERGEAVTPAKFNPYAFGVNRAQGTVVNIDASGAWFEDDKAVSRLAERVDRALERHNSRRYAD